jgi:hypothetical protein
MKLKLQLIIESDSGETEVVQEVTKLERHSLRPENLGLTLSEAKKREHSNAGERWGKKPELVNLLG